MIQELRRIVDCPCRPLYTARRVSKQSLGLTGEDQLHVLVRGFSTFDALLIVPDLRTRRRHHPEKREL